MKEMLELPDKVFKATLIKMPQKAIINTLKRKRERERAPYQRNTSLSKEMQNIKKRQMQILELKKIQ